MSEVTPNNKKESFKLFDEIAGTYDLLNILLSFGIDRLWRKKVRRIVEERPVKNALDMATGTGDMAILLAKSPSVQDIVGIDLSKEMISIGNQKIKDSQLSQKANLIIGDGVNIPYDNDSKDLITITFGIRNFGDYKKSIDNMYKVLRPGGRAIIMEFSLPKNPIIKHVYLLYFRYILPFFGKIISKHKTAYSYLNQTVEKFPYGKKFADNFYESGFSKVDIHPLTFGIASIYVAYKD